MDSPELLARKLLALTLPRVPHDCVSFPGPRPSAPLVLPVDWYMELFHAVYESDGDQQAVAALINRRQYSVWVWLQMCLFPFVDIRLAGYPYKFGITQFRNVRTGHGGLQAFADALGCSRGWVRDLYHALMLEHTRFHPPESDWPATGPRVSTCVGSWQRGSVIQVRRAVELLEMADDGRKKRRRATFLDRARYRGREYPEVRALQTQSPGGRTLWTSVPETKGPPYSIQGIMKVLAAKGG